MALFEPVGCVIQKALATAVPIGAFKALYAGEGLTVSKYVHRAAEVIRHWQRAGLVFRADYAALIRPTSSGRGAAMPRRVPEPRSTSLFSWLDMFIFASVCL